MFKVIYQFLAYRAFCINRIVYILVVASIVSAGVFALVYPLNNRSLSPNHSAAATDPLVGKKFYVDNNRPITHLAEQYRTQVDNGSRGSIVDSKFLSTIAVQPGSTWLTGPTESDTDAAGDIAEVVRTSRQANLQHQVPVYVLYAIPGRDACAGFSKGGFARQEQYINWVTRIKSGLQTKAVIVVEPDAILHALQNNCLSPEQKLNRYRMLHATVRSLQYDPHVMAVYIDAGNAEWMPDPQALVKPLRAAGIMDARGIAINTASFVDTEQSSSWAQDLLQKIGGDKAAIIDTSRNGRGAPAKQISGTARWCNPPGRGLGHVPSTQTSSQSIDAYVWIKKVGESDGNCFGNPPAGVYVPAQALELARHALL